MFAAFGKQIKSINYITDENLLFNFEFFLFDDSRVSASFFAPTF